MSIFHYIAGLIFLFSIIQSTHSLEWINHDAYQAAKIRDLIIQKNSFGNRNGFKLHQTQNTKIFCVCTLKLILAAGLEPAIH